MSASVGVPVTVTASLKPSVRVIVLPTNSVPVAGEAVACITAGVTEGGPEAVVLPDDVVPVVVPVVLPDIVAGREGRLPGC